MTNSSDNLIVNDPNHDLFVLLFVRAAREYRGEEAPNAYTRLLDIIRRVDAGESLEAMHDEKERRLKEHDEARRAATLAKPESKDKLSDEWRIWKLRQIEHAFRADREAGRQSTSVLGSSSPICSAASTTTGISTTSASSCRYCPTSSSRGRR